MFNIVNIYKLLFLNFVFVFVFINCKTNISTKKNIQRIPSCTKYSFKKSEAVLSLINRIRKKNNIREVYQDSQLIGIAGRRAWNLSKLNKLTHIDPSGNGPMERLNLAGIKRSIVGENLAIQKSNSKLIPLVIEGWYKLEVERKNLLNEKYSRIGTGFAMQKNKCIVVTIFTD